MKLLSWLVLFLMGAFCFATTEEPKTVTAKTLEYLDKVQDFDLDIINARANLNNAKIELAQLEEECAHTKKVVAKGYEYTKYLVGCQAGIVAQKTRISELSSAVEALSRNHEIWSIRLEAEMSGKTSLGRLAEWYLHKWRIAEQTVKHQIENARTRLTQNTEYYEWAKRNRMKGYITEFEYQRAMNNVTSSRNELDAQEERERQIAKSIQEAEANLALIPKEGTPAS